MIGIKGSNITIKGLESGAILDRNVHHLKKLRNESESISSEEEDFRGFEDSEIYSV